jgi:hypothetical protein
MNELSRMLRAVQSNWYDGLYVQFGWEKMMSGETSWKVVTRKAEEEVGGYHKEEV